MNVKMWKIYADKMEEVSLERMRKHEHTIPLRNSTKSLQKQTKTKLQKTHQYSSKRNSSTTLILYEAIEKKWGNLSI